MSRPNVLMIVIDCLRSDRIFGDDRTCKTPNIDALVGRGVGAPNLFVETSTTAPAFGTIFTGFYSFYHGVTALLGVRLRSDLFTLADAFCANGYRTYGELTGPLLPHLGLNQGFDEYNYRDQGRYFFTDWGKDLIDRFDRRGFMPPWFTLVHFWELHEPRQVPKEFDSPEFGATHYDRALSALDSYIGALVEAAGKDAVVILTGDHGERIDEQTHPDSLLPYFMKSLGVDTTAERAIQGIDEDIQMLNARGDELHEVSLQLAAHSREGKTMTVTDRIRLMGKLIAIGLSRMRIQKRPRPGLPGWMDLLRSKFNDLKVAWAVTRGDSEAAQMQLLRTTLCHFCLQHGYHLYDYLARVPFVIAGLDSLPAATRMTGSVRNIDIFPTLCGLLDLQVHEIDWHGASFAEALATGSSEDRPLYMEARGGAQAPKAFYVRGVRSGNFKLAYGPNHPKAPVELYNLTEDPKELQNIAPGASDAVARLRREAEAMAEAFAADGAGGCLSPREQAETIEKLKSLGYM